ncbi:MAG: helix-turn-helix transcriptional regulator [Terricaulis sp.]
MNRSKKKSTRSAGSLDLEIGERIRASRHARNITQQDLAGQLGITFQQLQKYESGANRVSASRLSDIATALGVAITEFLPGVGSHSGQTISAPDLAKLIALYLRLDANDQKRIIDYAARLADGA